LQNLVLSCSSEKKHETHSSVKNEVVEIWVKVSGAEWTKPRRMAGATEEKWLLSKDR